MCLERMKLVLFGVLLQRIAEIEYLKGVMDPQLTVT